MRRHSSGKEKGRKPKQECCVACGKVLKNDDRALFVEEELGRVFCSEECIGQYFAPKIQELEKQYFRRLRPYQKREISETDREKLNHLRWIVLQEPDEVWRNSTKAGDSIYTLISRFQPGEQPVWCVCLCLFLRGEPSFLFIAFSTGIEALVNQYRKGTTVPVSRIQKINPEPTEVEPSEEQRTDGLAVDWTEGESMRAQWGAERKADDIPAKDFAEYQSSLEETLEKPDEVWGVELGGEHLFHFIKRFSGQAPFWYVVIAKDSEDYDADAPADEAHLELLEAFPTIDPHLVDQYRRGEQQHGDQAPQVQQAQRLIH